MIKPISLILSKYLFYLAAVLLIPFGFAAYCEFFANPIWHPQPHSTMAFFWTSCLCVVVAALFRYYGRTASDRLRRREATILVVSIWLVTCFFAALPFVFSHTLKPLDAYFEAMSGLTTTGASLLCPKAYNSAGEEVAWHLTNPHVPDKTYSFYGTVSPVRDKQGAIQFWGVEAVSKAILLWRSMIQWIGGLGIVVIFLTVLPALQVGGKFLYQVETTGPIKEDISPRIRSSSKQMWGLYLALTILEIGLLCLTNFQMPIFDAICLALSNISTGGFSVRNESIASYGTSSTQWIIFLFMIAGSINFSLYFQALHKKWKRFFTPDLFLFITVALVGCLLVSLPLIGQKQTGLLQNEETYGIGSAFQEGCFQAISMQTSTGFVTSNYDFWPFPSQMFMLLLMFIGGMSGSTAGGIKTSRFYILFKIVQHRLESLFRPDSVRILRIGNTEVDDKNSLTVLSFFCIVAFFSVLGIVSFVLDGIDPETSFGLISCFLNNVGAAFRAAGPAGSFTFLSSFAKILSILWMLLGRLEYYVVLLLLLPSFWKNR